jgi:excisionase family DNA binding protein
MATTKSIVRQNEILNTLPLKLITPEGIRTQHATHLIAHESNGDIYLFFFDAPPPPRIGSPIGAAEKLANFNNLAATCIARIVINKLRWPQILETLQKCTDIELQYERKETRVPTLPTTVKITPVASQPGALLNAKEARRLLGVSDRTLYTLVKTGELAAIKIGKLVRFRPEDIETFIQKQRGAGNGKSEPRPTKQISSEQHRQANVTQTAIPDKHKSRQQVIDTNADAKNESTLRKKGIKAEQAEQRPSPFEVLLGEIGIDRDSLPPLTNGELRRIAEVDVPTMHGWMYLNRSLPEEARKKLQVHFSNYVREKGN